MTNTFKQTHRKLTAISHCESPCELSVSMVVAHIFIGDEHAGVYDEDVPNFHTNRCLTDRNCMYKLPIVLHFSLFHHIALTGFFCPLFGRLISDMTDNIVRPRGHWSVSIP